MCSMLRPTKNGKKRSSILLGLDTHDIIKAGNNGDASTTGLHTTRQAIHGRATQTLYNMKYHPMDEQTRPKRARKMRGGDSDNHFSFEGSDTDPGSYEECGSEMSSSDDEDDEDDEDDVLRRRRANTTGSRRSSRTATQKLVNYDRRKHPQDKQLAAVGIRRIHKHHRKTSPTSELSKVGKLEGNDERSNHSGMSPGTMDFFQ